MSSFLQRLFPSPATDSWRPLVRTAKEEQRHVQWVRDQMYLNWLEPYYKAYHFRKAHLSRAGLRVQLLQEDSREGAILFYDPSIGPGNFRHFFDYIAEQTLPLGYNASTSDQRVRHHPEYTETVLKHFLKPKPRSCTHTGRCQQHFGNVVVDLVLINGQPGFIRFFSNPFQDEIFTTPRPFAELLDTVFNQPPPTEATQARIKSYYRA
ncbi:hypothetical protein FY528_13790 [Hymenobacter lutimineralis]|uniref:Uncharacterized protein n=1 Tax=Hymenobacter lutimineralis TaxID=2606448 RepID=A0A5D6UY94_9BACT|nr:hypothetical protein [Hymenobacter lutimineralis]TYZ08110.1 hypothetical protein FY528_13790 [Hymenobacter lutimineralis]